ncbi:STAS domain-containing protein [Streptomyces sp. NBC_01618]|uniref:STAS domain-containing protein n=1 Tax=Streptomyces sp. NBC_01618 TaxID=2975900 RepID=UPI00386A84D1|nr:STAS domain-containing protein [Streptomyces sp. NBC_01618]
MSFGPGAGLFGMDPLPSAVLVLSGRVTRAGTPRLCADLETILATSDAAVVDCDVGGVVHPDLAAVETIARLSLVARREGGRRLRLRGTPAELQLLLDLVGLGAAVGLLS